MRVLKVPRVSISMTVLKALGLRPAMGATKLPAAPALWDLLVGGEKVGEGGEGNVHDKVDGAELLDAAVGGGFEGIELRWVSYINSRGGGGG